MAALLLSVAGTLVIAASDMLSGISGIGPSITVDGSPVIAVSVPNAVTGGLPKRDPIEMEMASTI